jgi:hypothetical protein
VVVLWSTKATQFIGGYVENTFVNFLTETSSTSTTVLKGMRFSGAESEVGTPGFKANTFTSDGIVTFDGNEFNVPSNASAQAMPLTPNKGLLLQNSAVWHHKDHSRIAVQTKKVGLTASGTVKNLFTFSRSTVIPNAYNRQSLAGWLTVMVQGETTVGSECFITKRIPILIRGYGTQNMVVVLGTSQDASDNAVGGTLTVGTTGISSTSATVTATFSLASFDAAELTAYLDVELLKHGASAIEHISVVPVLS